jgi:hypothetical protein
MLFSFIFKFKDNILYMYKRRHKNKSGFTDYCKAQLSRVKKARHAGSRSKSAHKYQKCLTEKHGIKTGYKPKKK